MLENRINGLITNIKEKPLYQYAILAVIILLAAVMRFYKLGLWSMWIDEIYTINRAQIHYNNPIEVIQSLPNTLWLPFSVILTKFFLSILGTNEWSARLASTIIGIVSVPILYLITRKFFGVWAALVSSLLLAISPWHVFWSQNARFYTALLLLYALTAFLFYLAIERNRPVYFIVFYILFYFALSERIIAAFILPTIIAYILFLLVFRFDRPPGLTYRNVLIFTTPVFFIIVFEFVRFALTGVSTASDFFTVFGEQQVEDPFRLLISIVYNISFPIITLGTTAAIYLLWKRSRTGLFVFLCAVTPIVLLMVMNPYVFTKDRYAFLSLAFWFMLAAYAIKEMVSNTQGRGKLLAIGMLAVLIADSAGSNLQYYLVNHGNRRDWRAAFAIVEERIQSDDVVVAWWSEFSPFYLDREILPFKDVTVDEISESEKRHWFVIDSETVWGNLPMQDWLEIHGQLIEILYLRLPEDDYNLKIYLYDPIHNSVEK